MSGWDGVESPEQGEVSIPRTPDCVAATLRAGDASARAGGGTFSKIRRPRSRLRKSRPGRKSSGGAMDRFATRDGLGQGAAPPTKRTKTVLKAKTYMDDKGYMRTVNEEVVVTDDDDVSPGFSRRETVFAVVSTAWARQAVSVSPGQFSCVGRRSAKVAAADGPAGV